jgi:hypothetical protein
VNTASDSNPTKTTVPAIVSPWVDAFCVGGGSLLLLVPMLLASGDSFLGTETQVHWWLNPVMGWLAVLVNWPHFFASYRMVYRSKATILKHPWASLYVPGFLLVFSAFAIWRAEINAVWIALLAIVAGGYLAWHYTGQAWGMMAAFAHLGGGRFDPTETRLIRGGLRLLLLWHLTWFFYTGSEMEPLRQFTTPVFLLVNHATFLAMALGVWGIARFTRRTGRLPPLCSLIPWVAIFIWYAAMARHPGALFWVQIAHALQYLVFPFRVEANKTAQRKDATRASVRRHLVGYVVALFLCGLVFQEFGPDAIALAVQRQLGDTAAAAAMMAPIYFVNIHHYFTDGCIWKLRNPEVRADLFAHLR